MVLRPHSTIESLPDYVRGLIGHLYRQEQQVSEVYGELLLSQLNFISENERQYNWIRYTLICHIQTRLKSRPIAAISVDAEEAVQLTPLMLLYGFKSSQLLIVADPPTNELNEDEKLPLK